MERDDVSCRANGMLPYKLIYGMDHVNFLFYEEVARRSMLTPQTFARSLIGESAGICMVGV